MIAPVRSAWPGRGVVIGAAHTDGQLELNQLALMRETAGTLDVTCHRVFDFTPDPMVALDQLADLNIRRVLSSGQAETAFAGRFLLQKMVSYAAGRVVIMPGAGINAANIGDVAKISGAREFHFTAKKMLIPPSASALPGLENGYWQSDEGLIRATINAVKVD